MGKAFPAPEVPFNGTCILEDREQELKEITRLKRASREGSLEARAELRERADEVAELEALKAEVLYIERLKSTRQALKKAQPESPAAKQAGLSVTRHPKVSAFYGPGEGVAHARPKEAWFAPVTITVFGDKPAEPRRFQPMKALVARAIDALYGRKAKSQPEPQGFDPAAASNAWADRVPEAEGESGPRPARGRSPQGVQPGPPPGRPGGYGHGQGTQPIPERPPGRMRPRAGFPRPWPRLPIRLPRRSPGPGTRPSLSTSVR